MRPQALIVMAQSASISSRIFRASRAQMVQALRSAPWASANKSSLATIFANPIYRGVEVNVSIRRERSGPAVPTQILFGEGPRRR